MKPRAGLTTIPVSDLDRARDFYSNVLELEPLKKWRGSDLGEWRGANEGAVYHAGDSLILLYPTEASSGDATRLSIEVDDFDSTVQSLRDKGVHFEDFEMPGIKTDHGVAEVDGMRGAWFKDPDGNMLAIGEGQLP